MNAENQTAVCLRQAVDEDLPAIVDILQSTVDWFRPFLFWDELESQHDVDLDWADELLEEREVWTAELDGEVVGMLSWLDAGDYLYVGHVFVDRRHVRQGVGSLLVDHAAAEARSQGKLGVVALVHPRATWAVGAARKFGFECIANSDASVCKWNDGWMEPYHERGSHLWLWNTAPEASVAERE